MSQWYVRNGDLDIGPLTGSELLGLIRQGAVKRDTPVRKNDSAWFAASDVGGLFDAASQDTYEYFCQECGTKVEKPPSVCPYCEIPITRAVAKRIQHKIDGHKPAAKPKRTASMNRWLQKIQTPRND